MVAVPVARLCQLQLGSGSAAPVCGTAPHLPETLGGTLAGSAALCMAPIPPSVSSPSRVSGTLAGTAYQVVSWICREQHNPFVAPWPAPNTLCGNTPLLSPQQLAALCGVHGPYSGPPVSPCITFCLTSGSAGAGAGRRPRRPVPQELRGPLQPPHRLPPPRAHPPDPSIPAPYAFPVGVPRIPSMGNTSAMHPWASACPAFQ